MGLLSLGHINGCEPSPQRQNVSKLSFEFLGVCNSTQLKTFPRSWISLSLADKTLKGCGLFCFRFFGFV